MIHRRDKLEELVGQYKDLDLMDALNYKDILQTQYDLLVRMTEYCPYIPPHIVLGGEPIDYNTSFPFPNVVQKYLFENCHNRILRYYANPSPVPGNINEEEFISLMGSYGLNTEEIKETLGIKFDPETDVNTEDPKEIISFIEDFPFQTLGLMTVFLPNQVFKLIETTMAM